MEIRLVKTDKQHRLYLAAIEKLMEKDPAPNSPAGARLELLAKLVEDYEKVRYPIQKPDAVEIIRFRMEQQGLRQKDLAEVLGGKNRVSEILSRKRPLTVPMIRALGRHLQIPAELLVR
jgi:HTH-type transcriptional regulator/antitoxin HigA